ncbi:MAG: hypothetical protein K2Y13_16525, partial [Burkholderiaceae bacterium]|nr:hypothetical protein [Burkholderiaceae bacterium]
MAGIKEVVGTVEVMVSVLSNPAAIVDNIKSAINDKGILSVSSDFGQAGAAVAGALVTVGVISAPVAIGVTMVAVTLTMTKVISDINKDPFEPWNLSDVLSLAGNAVTVIAATSPPGSIIAFGLGIAGATITGAGITQNNTDGRLPGIIGDTFGFATKPPKKDPLTLDLNGNGLETVGISKSNPIYFDQDGDGVKVSSGWVLPSDGYLVRDRNGNGTIDNGTELFGDSTILDDASKAKDGFDALLAEDTNHDGTVDQADANWTSLRVWQDLNQDGISQANELRSLEQLSIASFNVKTKENSTLLANGNQIADLGSYTKNDGSNGTIGDVAQLGDINLAQDTFISKFTDHITLSTEAAALPDVSGAGLVRRLQEAASLSPELAGLVAQFRDSTDSVTQYDLVSQIMMAWADTAGLKSDAENMFSNRVTTGNFVIDSYGDVVLKSFPSPSERDEFDATAAEWSKKFHILEAFNGRNLYGVTVDSVANTNTQNVSYYGPGIYTWFTLPGGSYAQVNAKLSNEQLGYLQQSYDALHDAIYSRLLMQTRFKPLLEMVALVNDANGASFDFSKLEAHFKDAYAATPAKALGDLIEFNRYSGIDASTGWNGKNLMADLMQSLPMTSELNEVYLRTGVLSAGPRWPGKIPHPWPGQNPPPPDRLALL